ERTRRKGVPGRRGAAGAPPPVVDEVLASHEPITLDDASVSGEISRFERACAAVVRELDDTIHRVSRQIGDEEAAIFHAHRQLLRDPGLHAKVQARIREQRVDAASALRGVLDEYAALFKQIPDSYLQERLTDLRDVAGRLIAQLAREAKQPVLQVNEPVILIAPEVLPSQAALI